MGPVGPRLPPHHRRRHRRGLRRRRQAACSRRATSASVRTMPRPHRQLLLRIELAPQAESTLLSGSADPLVSRRGRSRSWCADGRRLPPARPPVPLTRPATLGRCPADLRPAAVAVSTARSATTGSTSPRLRSSIDIARDVSDGGGAPDRVRCAAMNTVAWHPRRHLRRLRRRRQEQVGRPRRGRRSRVFGFGGFVAARPTYGERGSRERSSTISNRGSFWRTSLARAARNGARAPPAAHCPRG